ncbi:MAG TPA: squalene/phytoene synthase family protein, partial [Pirellulaceae bacterium]|nr:squalene/phytoene synthase family protein [Pirellulaceae bacterium]
MSLSLAESYRWCARTTWRAGSSFYWALWLLPAQRRLAMQALYAFARHTDDLSDDPSDDFALGGETTTRRRAALAGWRSAVEAAFADPDEAIAGRSPSPLLPAVADTLRRFSIPPRHLLAIIDGVERDLDPVRYQTFAELRSYCELVASAVGLACLKIWGCDAPPATPHAIECGVAFQLTNILRDVGEDLRRGRLY